ncbi:hypothetical protein ACNF49_46165 [Actinomadura sp. ATCC 39365]
MTTAFRAVLAFSLLAGFYVLVGVILVAAVFFDVLLLVDFHTAALKVAIVLTLAAGALVRALFMVGRRQGASCRACRWGASTSPPSGRRWRTWPGGCAPRRPTRSGSSPR